MDEISISEAAAKYGIDERRLLGAIWMENQTGNLQLPIGSFELRMVQDDERLAVWAAQQRGPQS